MTDLDDAFSWPPLTAPTPSAPRSRRACEHIWDEGKCSKCDKSYALFLEQSARGRKNKKRGNALQRKAITELGGTNLAGNNPNLDGVGLMFRYEHKSGGAFSTQYAKWLWGIPAPAGMIRVLLVTETPGPGRKARRYVALDYDDWKDLHGE